MFEIRITGEPNGAGHCPDPAAWPAPEDAYANAPSNGDEITWITATSAHTPIGQGLDREYFLRKAALLDRMALAESDRQDDVIAAALEAARILAALDGVRATEPRAYVRQQYAAHARCVCDDFGEGDCLLHPNPDH